MTAQFVHLETYGRVPKKGAKRHETVSGILGEASRRPSSSLHIATARQPVRLFGADPFDLKRTIATLAEKARDSAGRRLRPDAGLLVAAVVSYPVPWTEMQDANRQSPYLEWRDQSTQWLLSTFGETVASIVEHSDERYPHLHAFLVPDLTATNQIDWNNVHPGRAAKIASAGRLETTAAQDAAYISAMKALADDYHRAVSTRFAHARVTVRRNRRSRAHHLEIRQLESQNASLARKLTETSRELSRMRNETARHRASDMQEEEKPQFVMPVSVTSPTPDFLEPQGSAGLHWPGTELEHDDNPLPEDIDPAHDDGNDDPDVIDADPDHEDPDDVDLDNNNNVHDDLTWEDYSHDPPAGYDDDEQ